MNLFEGITNRQPVYKNKSLIPNTPDIFGSGANFFGTTPKQSIIPTAYKPVSTPTQQQGVIQKHKHNPEIPLFADEQQMLQRMKADNLSDDQAYQLIKKRRTDLLGGSTAIGADEKQMLMKMQADNLTAKQAVAMIQKRRYDNVNKIRDMHPNEGVGEQTAKAVPRAIGDVASQAWQGVGQGLEGLINASFRGVNDINQMIGSSDYSPELTKALPQSGYLGDVAKIGAGTTTSMFNLGKAPISLGINTANQLPGTQYITQGIGKAIQYGAEKGWEMTGLDKETSMDIATTGMNLLGIKPGKNTLQYGRDIKSAYAGIETPGLFNRGVIPAAVEAVKAPGQALVQTVRMPYDIAKGTIQGGKNIVRNIQPAIASASDAIQTGINRMTKGEINKFQAEQGVSPGKYLNDRGIVDSGKPIEETLLEQMKTSRDQATAGMDAIQGNYKMPERQFGDGKIDYLRQMLLDNYNKAKNTLDAEGTTKAKQLLDKYDSEGLSMSEINQSKRKMAENNPVNWLTDSASDRVQTVKKISDEVRNWQFKQAEKAGFTNLKEINKQTQAFYKLHEGITKWNDGIEANNKISLTDYLAFDADPSVFLAKKVLSSPRVRQGIVKTLNKVSGRVVKPTEKATIGTINTKRAEYDFGNRNSDIGDRVDTREQLALPPASGKASGAKNVRVNQPKETTGYKNETQVGKRPTGEVKTTNAVVNIAKETASRKTMKSVKEEIASNVKQARFGGVGETQVQNAIESNLMKGKITLQEAKTIVEDILDSVNKGERTYPYTTKKGLESYLEKLYDKNYKIDGADLFGKSTQPVNLAKAKGGFIRNPFAKPEPKLAPELKAMSIPKDPIVNERTGETLLEGKTLEETIKDIKVDRWFPKRTEALRQEYELVFREAEKVMDEPMYSVQLPDKAQSGSMYLYIDKKLPMNEWKIDHGGHLWLIYKKNIDKIRISNHVNQSRIVANGPNVSDDKNFRSISSAKSYLKDKYGIEGLDDDFQPTETPVKNPLVEEARKMGIDLNKYFENVSEKSAIKMADYASDIVGKKMIKGERPMDMSELGMLSNKINKNEAGGNISTVGDILKDSELRKLYEKSLDTPITILDERVAKKGQLGGYVPMGEGRYGGHIVLFGGNKEISNNLPKSILHEAAHAIRDSKGRKLAQDYRISPKK